MIKRDLNPKISFHSLVKPFHLNNRKLLKRFVFSIFIDEQKRLNSLTVVFCSDDYLLRINTDFLHHNYYTDIITFNLADKNADIIGELYISVDRVKENAHLLNESFSRELIRVIFHGALHLCGYKDKTKKDITFMRSREDLYLTKYYNWSDVPRGT